MEVPDEVVIAKIVAPAGPTPYKIGEIIAYSVDDESELKDFHAQYSNNEKKAETPTEKVEKEAKKESKAPAKAKTEGKEKIEAKSEGKQKVRAEKEVKLDHNRIFISPKAKVLAQERGIDYTKGDIKGSGPEGRIISQDIEQFKVPAKKEAVQKKQETQPKQKKEHKVAEHVAVSPELYEEIPLNNMRKVIAERLTASKQNIPHYYLTSKVEMNALLAFKKKLQDETGLKFSVSDFIVKAVSFACQEVPEANSQWADDKILRFHDVDVSFAVDTGDGLITPIVKKANLKTISAISKESKELVEKAKSKKLKPEEFVGGTFTISNLGMMGIDSFSAVINPPQSCILAIGRTVKEPVYDEKDAKGFRFADVMTVTLSCDHRVVDGAVGAKWLQAFKKYIENPLLITL